MRDPVFLFVYFDLWLISVIFVVANLIISMNTNTNKAPYEVPVVEVLYFQISGSIVTASNEIIPINPVSPFSISSSDDVFGSSIDDGLYF